MTAPLLLDAEGPDSVRGDLHPDKDRATCDPDTFGRDRPDPHAVPLAHGRASAVSLDDCTAVYDEMTHALIMLNTAASAVWERCDGTSTFDELVSSIARRHLVEEAVVHDDVWRTLRQLAGLGLVTDAR